MYVCVSIKEGYDEVAYPAMTDLFNEVCFSWNLPCFCDGNSYFFVVGVSADVVLHSMNDNQKELLDVEECKRDLYVGNAFWK